MIYLLLKPFIRLAIKIFCRHISVSDPAVFNAEGPLLITANHPNSFLDAIIIGAYFNRPVHFLARGDAFNKPWHSVLLKTLHMFPVYRLSEGKENLGLNSRAFENSKIILGQNGIVLIFIEGICLNKNTLQPFKKGAARIAHACWEAKIPLRVLPMGLHYDNFTRFGKNVQINTSPFLNQAQLNPFVEEAKNFSCFNQILFNKIQPLITPAETPKKLPAYLLPAAIIGNFLHQPLYRIIQKAVQQKTKGTVFYDSVLFGILFFSYPFYLLLIAGILKAFAVSTFWVLLMVLFHPISAYSATRYKANINR